MRLASRRALAPGLIDFSLSPVSRQPSRMKTDKQLYTIFQACPVWLFELTGQPSPGKCELRSLTVKALERTADGLVVPVADDQKLTVVEFQFQPDPKIYLRVVEEMAAAQREYGMRDVQGFLFVATPGLEPQNSVWKPVVQTFVLRDAVQELATREPQHPLAAVFQPMFESQVLILQTQAVVYYRAIKTSNLDPQTRMILLDVFLNLLEQRLPHLGYKELQIMMLGELPDLEDTQLGKDLIQIGEARGEARGLDQAVVLFLQARFGRLSKVMRTQIERLSSDEAKELIAQIPSWDKLQDVKDWLRPVKDF